jgi:hypothetical protein
MRIEPESITTKERARQVAVEWQHWASEQSLSTSELIMYQTILCALARKFHLIREFKENGII